MRIFFVCYPLVCLLLGTVWGSASWWREAAMNALAVALLAAAFHAARRRERWPRPGAERSGLAGALFEPALAALFLVLVAGALHSPCAGRSWRLLVMFAAAAAAFYLALGSLSQEPLRGRMFQVMTMTAAAAALLGLYAYARGWTPRVAAPLGHHNYMAGFLLLHLPPAWARAGAAHSRGARLVGYGAAAVLAIAIVFTGSLAGVAVLGTLAVVAARSGAYAPGRRAAAILLAAIAVVSGALLFRYSGSPVIGALRQRIAGIVGERRDPSLSLENRVRYARAGVAMAAARPLAGFGLASVPLVSSGFRRQTPGLAPPGELLRQLHNLPVNLLAETGLLGLAAAVLLAFAALRPGAYAPGGRGRTAAAAIAVWAYLVFALNDYQLDVPAILFPLAIMAALAVENPAHSDPAPAPRRLALAFLLLLAVGGALLFTRSAVAHYLYQRGDAARAAAWDSHCGFYAMQAGRHVDAAREMPDVVPAAALAGGALVEAGQYGRSLEWLERAAALDHYNSLAHFHLGRARLRTGDRSGAIESFSMSLLAQPATVFAEAWQQSPEREVYTESLERAIDKLYELAAFYPRSGPWRRWNELGAYLVGRRGLLPQGPYRVLFFELVDRDLAVNHSLIAFRRMAPPARVAPVVLLLPTPQPRPPAGLGALEGLPPFVAGPLIRGPS